MSGSIEPPTRIPFGPFEADLPSQELRKQGVRLRLPKQSFQILEMLLERPGEVVTREELRARLWAADTFVDFNHGLNAAVKRLRDALGDAAENPRTSRRCRSTDTASSRLPLHRRRLQKKVARRPDNGVGCLGP